MCGIVGVINAPDQRSQWVTSACASIAHRGPDDVGSWRSKDGLVVLAHRRLAVIDVSDAGHQPMHTADNRVSIVFNGEIYNFSDLRTELTAAGHKFVSNSDTEVILAAYRQWGIECLRHLNGMFAFGLYDADRARCFLGRDRAGEKPLFYTIRDGTLAFASELKALLANPALERRIDVEALDCYFAFGYVPGERCMLQGVRKLPPAHALTFEVNTGDYRIWRYWRLPEPPAAPLADESALLIELEHLLEDAVRRQLVADVPVGVLLSGGIDSSLVTAFAARSRSKLSTFTVRFPGYNRFDETEYARLIARAFNTDHVELEASNPSVTLLPTLAKQFDEPIADSSMVPTYLVSHLTREHCKVALSGDGGDELFAGYPHYPRLLWLQRNASRIPRSLRRAVSTVAPAVLPIGFRGRNWTRALAADLERDVPHIGVLFDAKTRQRLMSGYRDWKTVAEEVWHNRIPQTGDLLQRATRMDFENFLPDDILVKVDRASMLTSLEVRAPLLDHRIVEFAFGRVPSHLKATLTERKILLKRLAARLLPREFDFARKQGFSIPLGTFLRSGSWRAFFRDVLNDSESTFDKSVTNQLLRGQLKGRANHERLFALVMFELWRQEYGAVV